MRLLLQRPCVFLANLLGLCALGAVACLVVSQFWSRSAPVSSFLSPDDFPGVVRRVRQQQQQQPPSSAITTPPPPTQCTMDSCFDRSRCGGTFRVFVYPDVPGHKPSPLYSNILKVLRESSFYTSNPDQACLFVPSLDTLDRDKRSENYASLRRGMGGLLPHWNGGRNHVILNLFSGTYPSYSETLDFDTGIAIVARASAEVGHFRQGFDVSLPLVHPNHPLKAGEPSQLGKRGNLLPIDRKYLLAFKGKRYLYGIGSETRSSLFHIHNGRDVMLFTTCKHNIDWERYQDDRCPN